MLKITIIAVGKIKEKFWQESIQEYSKRLKPYVVLDFVEIKAEAFSVKNKKQSQIKENKHLINILEKYESKNIYLLAEDGKELNSLGFSKFIESKLDLVFVIGGALGWAEEIRKKYPQAISLSQLTMPHEMARVVLLEQIYRATTIINDKDYHY
ncbi:MAG: 23S rRNA (pseudouridine(1915)-N(3))-methyltransferase RlmH [Patescibacteria group bacterium]|jgi:23S rRNA (pseudouridine1915-N3)-methyltransferase